MTNREICGRANKAKASRLNLSFSLRRLKADLSLDAVRAMYRDTALKPQATLIPEFWS